MVSNFDESKKVITTRSLFVDCFRFNKRSFHPCVVPLDVCLGYMVQSGDYALAPEFVTSAFKKIDFGQAQCYWRMMHEPKNTTVEEVRSIMFDHRSYDKGFRKRYFETPVYQSRIPAASSPPSKSSLVETSSVVTPQSTHPSLVNRLVSQCRQGTAAMAQQDKTPNYPIDDLVTFTESRTAGEVEILTEDGYMIRMSNKDNEDEEDLCCPPTLVEMMNITKKIRDQRLKSSNYRYLCNSVDASSNSKSSFSSDPEADDEEIIISPLKKKRTPPEAYRKFCLDSDLEEEEEEE